MPPVPTYQRSRELLATPLEQIRGVGPRCLEKLSKLGLASVEDALYHLPLRYEDRRQLREISALRPGRQEVFCGEIVACGEAVTSRSRRKLYEVIVRDGSGQVSLKWFHYRKAWMQKTYAKGRRAVFIGEIKQFGGTREVHHPDVEFVQGECNLDALSAADPLNFGRIVPVYPLTDGLPLKVVRKILKDVVERFAPVSVSPLPEDICKRRRLQPLAEAFREAHWPTQTPIADLESSRDQARRTLVFDEFFFLELGLALKRRGVVLESGIPFSVAHRYTKPLAKMLPYRMTDAQRRVLGEIKGDLMQPHPMNRLVQGDVGSGKTIVALMAALLAIENDTQVAVVAPTEILAEQHYLQFHPWMTELGLRVEFLSGSMTAKQKAEVYEQIGEGRVHMVVGTHAVLQKGVHFKRLGLGIIDEQHRFGVRQRGILRKKGEVAPHLLVMTATPIPRTLALTLYGDLSLSVIDEMPPGRSPIQTRIFNEGRRRDAYSFIRKELEQGRQAFIVYPLVEESEKSDLRAASEGAAQLQRDIFPGERVGLIHGRMSTEEKEGVMADFKAGTIQILVSTTVIEVGIDVPNATVMMVEHAERFGLAQLHQLRGRVGRGAARGHCLLIRSFKCSEDGHRRLEVMCETTDGFRIAEADLEIRGPGEFLGTRQSGLPDFRVANLLRDGRILEEAREEAFALADSADFLTSDRYAELRQALVDRWGSRLELAAIG